jgi:hypothetical protein
MYLIMDFDGLGDLKALMPSTYVETLAAPVEHLLESRFFDDFHGFHDYHDLNARMPSSMGGPAALVKTFARIYAFQIFRATTFAAGPFWLFGVAIWEAWFFLFDILGSILAPRDHPGCYLLEGGLEQRRSHTLDARRGRRSIFRDIHCITGDIFRAMGNTF